MRFSPFLVFLIQMQQII